MRNATLILAALILSVLRVPVSADEKKPLAGKELIEQLKKGGYVIFFRHCATNEDQADTDTMHLDNLKAQRHLSDKGRDQSREIGKAFQQLDIPIKGILTSKFYRAQEVGKLLDLGPVT